MRIINCLWITFLFACTTNLYAQGGKEQNLYFARNNGTGRFSRPDYMPGKENFYIYRNFVYYFKLKTKESFWMKVTDIRNDSIHYIRYYNLLVPWREKDKQAPDTFRLHPSSILAIGKQAMRKGVFFHMHSVRSSNFYFVQNDSAKRSEPFFKTIESYDRTYTTTYEYIPYVTRDGLDSLRETVSTTYVADSAKIAAARVIKKYRKKKGVWFTPTNVNEIRGVNIGALTLTLNNGPLDIRGVNLNADVASFFLGAFFLPYVFDNSFANMPDTVEMDMKGGIRGLSISGGGLFNSGKMYGLGINGIMFFSDEIRGMVITGMQSQCQKFSGIMISGLRNKSVNGKGIQIGLLNVCRNLKGIQIGLWNINSKRKLPFFNWGV
jgi:hypothetical protein